MRRVILWCYALRYQSTGIDGSERTDVLTFVIRVILVTDVPVDVLCQFDRQPDLGHVVRERIRVNEILRPGYDAIALPRVMIEPIACVEGDPLERMSIHININIIVALIVCTQAEEPCRTR